MEDCKTKYIESSLSAFRVINDFVLQKGAYPKSFYSELWKEEDYSITKKISQDSKSISQFPPSADSH